MKGFKMVKKKVVQEVKVEEVKVKEEPKDKFKIVGKTKMVGGSILMPENAGLRLILNIANLAGKVDTPIYKIFNKKWNKVSQELKGWYHTKNGFYKFGALNTLAVQSDVWVISMLCQDEELKTDFDGLKKCLKQVLATAKSEKASIHVSTIFTDMIPELNDLLISELVNNGINVYFYKE